MSDGQVIIDVDVRDKKALQSAKGIKDSFKDLKDYVTKDFDKIGEAFTEVGGVIQGVGGNLSKFITAPVVAAVTASVKSFADLEQAVGGIETMFKDAADVVIKNSETAYRRAGVSGVNYMEQVTSFSATLLQGLGGDTVKAAKYADTAMVDMSDNANKFGTNIEDIQNAYQGFAKDNFTMLDNLKLGYGGTAGEMARLINESGVLGDTFEATAQNVSDIPFHVMVEAIHEIQNELGVTGTTALEAEETVSGAFGMMKASLQDLLAGFGDSEADIEQLMENLFYSVGVFVDNVKRVLGNIWDNLPLSPFQKWAGLILVGTGPVLLAIGSIMTSVGSMMETFTKLQTHGPVLSKFFKLAFSGPILGAIAVIGLLILAFKDLWKNNEYFRDAVTEIWNSITGRFKEFTDDIKERLNNLGINFESWGELLKNIWSGITDFLASVFITAFENVEVVIDTVLETILDLFDLFVAVLNGDWEAAWDKLVDIVFNILGGLEGIFENTMDLIYSVLFNAWNAIYDYVIAIVSNLLEGTTEHFDEILNNIKMTMRAVWGVIETVWNYIKETFLNVTAFLKALVSGDFATMKDIIGEQLTLMKETASELWDKIKEIFFLTIDSIVLYFSEKFEEFKEAFSEWAESTWNSIVEWFEQLPGYLKEKWDQVVTDVTEWGTNMWEKAKETGKRFIENITIFFQELPGKVEKWLKDTWNKTTTWASDTWEKGKEAGRKFVDNTIEFFKQLPGKIETWLNDTIEKLKNWVKDMGNKGKEAGDDVTKKTTEAVKALPGKMTDAGKEVVNGFWQGIKNMGTTLKNNVTGFFTGIVDGVKDTLGIKSPSKVFEGIGKPSAEGWGVGFVDMFGSVMKMVQNTMNKGIDNLKVNPVVLGIKEDIDSVLGDLDAINNKVLNYTSPELSFAGSGSYGQVVRSETHRYDYGKNLKVDIHVDGSKVTNERELMKETKLALQREGYNL